MPDSPTFSRAVQLALNYIGFGRDKRKQVTQEPVDAVLGDGGLHVADANLRTSGDMRGIAPGTTVPVLWSRANLAPGAHGVKPAVVLAHHKREGPPPPPLRAPSRIVVAGAVEELFIALTEAGQLDVWFRNDVLCAPLNVRGALAAAGPLTDPAFAGVNLNEQLTRVRWGTQADRFHVELGGPPGAYFAVFQLVRSATAASVFKRLTLLPTVTLKRLEPVGVAEFNLGTINFDAKLSGNRQKWTFERTPPSFSTAGAWGLHSVEPMDGSYARRSVMSVVLNPGAFYRTGDGVTSPPQHFGDETELRRGHLTAFVAQAIVDDHWQLAVTIWFAFNNVHVEHGGQFRLSTWLTTEHSGGLWTTAVARYYRVEALDANDHQLSVSSEGSVHRLCPDGQIQRFASFPNPPNDFPITRAVQLRWDRVPHAASYRIWRSETPNVYVNALLTTVAALAGPDPVSGLLMQDYIDVGTPTGAGTLTVGLDPGGLLPHPIGAHYWQPGAQNFFTRNLGTSSGPLAGSSSLLGIDNDTALGQSPLGGPDPSIYFPGLFADVNVNRCRWKPGMLNAQDEQWRTVDAADPNMYFDAYGRYFPWTFGESHTAILLLDHSQAAPGWTLLWGSYDFTRGILLDFASDLWFNRSVESSNFSDPHAALLTTFWDPTGRPGSALPLSQDTPFDSLPGAIAYTAVHPTLGRGFAHAVPSWRFPAAVASGAFTAAIDIGNVGEGGGLSLTAGYYNGLRSTFRGDLFPDAALLFLPPRTAQYFSTSRLYDAGVQFFSWLSQAYTSGQAQDIGIFYKATWLHSWKQHNNYVSAIPLRWNGTTATLLLVNVETSPSYGSSLAGQPARLQQSGLFLYAPQTQEVSAIRPLADYVRFPDGTPTDWPVHAPIYAPLQWTADFVVWADRQHGGTYVTHLPAAGWALSSATTVRVAADSTDPVPWDGSDVVIYPELDTARLTFKPGDTQASFLRLGKLGGIQSLYDRREVGGRHFLDWLDANEPRVLFEEEASFPKRISLVDPEPPAVLKTLPASVGEAVQWASYRIADLAPP